MAERAKRLLLGFCFSGDFHFWALLKVQFRDVCFCFSRVLKQI